MSKVDMVNEIGDALTQIDVILSDPDFSPATPEWHQLFALRKHLDDQQRELVQEVIADDTSEFDDIAKQLSDAADALDKVGDDITKIGTILQKVSSIASLVDKVLTFA